MFAPFNVFVELRDFLEQGGVVLWALFILSFMLWVYVIRYWEYLRGFTKQKTARRSFLSLHLPPLLWRATAPKAAGSPLHTTDAPRLNNENSTKLDNEWAIYYNELDLTSQTKQMMKPIKTICALAPLMGLLGTLIGMIEIFDVIAISGTGNIRALASGIAAATLPTMAGMVISVVGLLFVILLERKTKEVVS